MKRSFFICIVFALFTQLLYSQNVLRGIVVDASNGMPLAGANLVLESSRQFATSDKDGLFEMSVPAEGERLLEISYIGYQTKIVELQNTHDMLRIELLPDVELLGTVVVTATRHRRGAYEVPIRMGIVKKDQVEAMPLLSTDDALKGISGINVSRGASMYGSSTVSMRGMGNEAGRTLVLLDGVPVNKADGGSVNWNAIPFADLEQVEVIKGPGSSIYGGNAMGGVINMITQTPQKKFEAWVSQRIGTFETYQTQLALSGREERFYWALKGMYRTSDGYVTTPADEIDDFSVASFLDEQHFGGRLGYNLTKNQTLEIAGGYYEGKRGTGENFKGYGFENDNIAADDGAYNQYSKKDLRMVYRNAINEVSHINVTLYGQQEVYANIRENLRNDRITRYDVESVRDDLGLNSSLHFPIGNSHLITTGIDYRYGAVDGNDRYVTSSDLVINKGIMNQLGVYAQDEISLGQSPFALLLGLRFDFTSFGQGEFLVLEPTRETEFLQDFHGDLPDATFTAFSPRISLQFFKKENFRLYAGYSRGFRPAVLDDLCRTGRISGGMKLANPNLKPEYLDNFELGADFFQGRNLKISPTIYYALGRDYHAYISTGDSMLMNNRMRPIRIKDNIGEVRIFGAELELSLQLTKGLSWQMAYSHTHTEIKRFDLLDPSEDDDIVGNALVYQPSDFLYSAVRWESPVLNGFLSINYKGAQWLNEVNTESIDAFLYVDMRIWRSIYKGLEASVGVHNLFDHDYIDSRNMIAPGRMITAELSYRL